MKVNLRVWLILLLVGFTGFIVWVIAVADSGGHLPLFALVKTLPLGDKLGHFGLFGLLTLLANLAFANACFRLGRYTCLTASALILLLVTLEELSQHYLPHRTLDLFDWLADLAGILCFSWLSIRLRSGQKSARQGRLASEEEV